MKEEEKRGRKGKKEKGEEKRREKREKGNGGRKREREKGRKREVGSKRGNKQFYVKKSTNK